MLQQQRLLYCLRRRKLLERKPQTLPTKDYILRYGKLLYTSNLLFFCPAMHIIKNLGGLFAGIFFK